MYNCVDLFSTSISSHFYEFISLLCGWTEPLIHAHALGSTVTTQKRNFKEISFNLTKWFEVPSEGCHIAVAHVESEITSLYFSISVLLVYFYNNALYFIYYSICCMALYLICHSRILYWSIFAIWLYIYYRAILSVLCYSICGYVILLYVRYVTPYIIFAKYY